MAVEMNPPGTPLPEGHPLKGGLIVCGVKRPSFSAKPSTPTRRDKPMPDKPREESIK